VNYDSKIPKITLRHLHITWRNQNGIEVTVRPITVLLFTVHSKLIPARMVKFQACRKMAPWDLQSTRVQQCHKCFAHEDTTWQCCWGLGKVENFNFTHKAQHSDTCTFGKWTKNSVTMWTKKGHCLTNRRQLQQGLAWSSSCWSKSLQGRVTVAACKVFNPYCHIAGDVQMTIGAISTQCQHAGATIDFFATDVISNIIALCTSHKWHIFVSTLEHTEREKNGFKHILMVSVRNTSENELISFNVHAHESTFCQPFKTHMRITFFFYCFQWRHLPANYAVRTVNKWDGSDCHISGGASKKTGRLIVSLILTEKMLLLEWLEMEVSCVSLH